MARRISATCANSDAPTPKIQDARLSMPALRRSTSRLSVPYAAADLWDLLEERDWHRVGLAHAARDSRAGDENTFLVSVGIKRCDWPPGAEPAMSTRPSKDSACVPGIACSIVNSICSSIRQGMSG